MNTDQCTSECISVLTPARSSEAEAVHRIHQGVIDGVRGGEAEARAVHRGVAADDAAGPAMSVGEALSRRPCQLQHRVGAVLAQ